MFKEYKFNMNEDIGAITNINLLCHNIYLRHKAKIDNIKSKEQRLVIHQYFTVLNELSSQACDSLKSNRLSVVEVLTRVIIEQSANQNYIAIDNGKNAQSLLRDSKKMLIKNGENWLSYLQSKGFENPAAQERIRLGKQLVEHFNDKWPDAPPYPGVKRLFQAIEWENPYHSYYVPLCDSVHSFSDDMVNLIALSDSESSTRDSAINFMMQENKRLAIYNLASATYLRCLSLGNSFIASGFDEIIQEIMPAMDGLVQIINRNDEYDHSRIPSS